MSTFFPVILLALLASAKSGFSQEPEGRFFIPLPQLFPPKPLPVAPSVQWTNGLNLLFGRPSFSFPGFPSLPSGSGSSSCPCPSQDFNSQAVSQHNCYRSQHRSAALTQTAALNTAAQKYATLLAGKIAAQGVTAFAHSPEASAHAYGENLALMPGCSITGCAAVDAWYNEIKQYSFSNPGFSASTGHFTQLVWKESTEVGTGRATTTMNGSCYTVVVANYKVPGNNPATFSQNVLPK